MARLFSIRPTWSLKGRRFQGVRGFTGKPFHPPLTDFPIVCFTLAALFDLISFFSKGDPFRARDFFVAATFVMVAGYVVAILAIITGFWDWWKGIPRDRKSGPIGKAKHTQVWRTINWHATVMITAQVLTFFNLFQRIPNFEEGQTLAVWLVLSLLAGRARHCSVPPTAGRSCSSTASTSRTSRRSGRRARSTGLPRRQAGSRRHRAAEMARATARLSDADLGDVERAAADRLRHDRGPAEPSRLVGGAREQPRRSSSCRSRRPTDPRRSGRAFTSSGAADNGTFHDRSEVTVARGRRRRS